MHSTTFGVLGWLNPPATAYGAAASAAGRLLVTSDAARFLAATLLGALAGAFAGAALATKIEGHDNEVALRSGFAAFRGRLLGFIVKSAIGVAMTVVLISAAL